MKTLLSFVVLCAGCGGEGEIAEGLTVSVATSTRITRNQMEVARVNIVSSLSEDIEIDELDINITHLKNDGSLRNFRLADNRRGRRIGKMVNASKTSISFNGLSRRVRAGTSTMLVLLADLVRDQVDPVAAEVRGDDEAWMPAPIDVPGACVHYKRQIRKRGILCEAGPPMPSPTGHTFSCNYHTSPGGKSDPRIGTKSLGRVISLDIPAEFGEVIRAPVAGTVEISERSERDCIPGRFSSCASGNRISILFGDGYRYTIVHVFDFLVPDGARVKVGDPIANVGGQCCREYNTPEARRLTSWRASDGSRHFWSSTCNYAPPFCAPPWEAGNSAGPHLHISISKDDAAIPILPCFQGVGIDTREAAR